MYIVINNFVKKAENVKFNYFYLIDHLIDAFVIVESIGGGYIINDINWILSITARYNS